jgi:hypothetical protein
LRALCLTRIVFNGTNANRRAHLGRERTESLARELDGLPSPGAEYWHFRLAVVQASCPHAHASARVAPLKDEQQPSSNKKRKRGGASEHDCCQRCEAAFQKAVLAHGEDDLELWLAWVAFRRKRGSDSSAIVQQGIATLQADLADQFTLALQKL